jgi:hypothetical protein
MIENFETIKSDLIVTKCLPQNLRLNCNHFYKIGLSLFSFGSETRHLFYNPFLILFINLIYFAKSIFSLLLKEENENLFILIGDFSYFIKARIHFNGIILFVSCVALISQLLNFWYYKNNIKPTFLQPLKMISGLVSPQSIGFTNKSDIYKLLNRSKILLSVSRYLSLSTFLFSFIFSFVILFLNSTQYQIIFLSIPISCLSFILALSLLFIK